MCKVCFIFRSVDHDVAHSWSRLILDFNGLVLVIIKFNYLLFLWFSKLNFLGVKKEDRADSTKASEGGVDNHWPDSVKFSDYWR